jgi:hypothetical protein
MMVGCVTSNLVESTASGVTEYQRDVVLTAAVPWILRKVTGLEQMEMTSQVKVLMCHI